MDTIGNASAFSIAVVQCSLEMLGCSMVSDDVLETVMKGSSFSQRRLALVSPLKYVKNSFRKSSIWIRLFSSSIISLSCCFKLLKMRWSIRSRQIDRKRSVQSPFVPFTTSAKQLSTSSLRIGIGLSYLMHSTIDFLRKCRSESCSCSQDSVFFTSASFLVPSQAK